MRVTEQLFEPKQVASVVDVLNGEAVAQAVRAYFFGKLGAFAGAADDVLHAPHGNTAAL
jgi:hypothetical protein